MNKDKLKPMIVVLGGGLLVLILKLIAYYISNSMALKSDALESLVNILSGIFALFALFYASRPADVNHPYGHGKIEFFSAFFEGGLIVLAGILIVYESIEKLILGVNIEKLTLGLAINFLAGIINGIMGYWLLAIGKKKNSSAIYADGKHLLSDFYTTLGIFFGLLLTNITNYYFLDPVLSFILGFFLLITGIQIILKSTAKLLDAENQELLSEIVNIINQIDNPNIITLHGLRVMESGNFIHIDAHLVVPEFYSVKEIHEHVNQFENRLIQKLGIKGELHSHIDPCKRDYCKICKLNQCPIRMESYSKEFKLSYESAIHWPVEDRKRLKRIVFENL